MEQTEKLGLWLPGKNDPLDISRLNENSRKLDEYAREAGSAHKVGDILATWRTDLGADWMLCNGTAFSKLGHPALAAVAPGMPTMADVRSAHYRDGLVSGLNTTYKAAVNNWAKHGNVYAAMTGYGELLVSSDMFLNAEQYRPFGSYGTTNTESRVFYVNDQWVIAQQTANTISAFWLADDPAGPWTKVPLTGMNFSIQHLEYYNGEYWAFGSVVPVSSNKAAAIYGHFASFNITGFPLERHSFGPSACRACKFVRTDDSFVFVSLPSTAQKTRMIAVYSATDPAGEWTDSGDIATFNSAYTSDVSWANGKLVFLANYALTFLDGGTNKLLTGYPPPYPPSDNDINNSSPVLYARGYYIFACGELLSIGRDYADGGGGWQFDLLGGALTAPSTAILYNDPGGNPYFIIIFTRSTYSENGSEEKVKLNVLRLPCYAVPNISTPQAYTYIKAEE